MSFEGHIQITVNRSGAKIKQKCHEFHIGLYLDTLLRAWAGVLSKISLDVLSFNSVKFQKYAH